VVVGRLALGRAVDLVEGFEVEGLEDVTEEEDGVSVGDEVGERGRKEERLVGV
jgi:hypothetical protein